MDYTKTKDKVIDLIVDIDDFQAHKEILNELLAQIDCYILRLDRDDEFIYEQFKNLASRLECD